MIGAALCRRPDRFGQRMEIDCGDRHFLDLTSSSNPMYSAMGWMSCRRYIGLCTGPS